MVQKIRQAKQQVQFVIVVIVWELDKLREERSHTHYTHTHTHIDIDSTLNSSMKADIGRNGLCAAILVAACIRGHQNWKLS